MYIKLLAMAASAAEQITEQTANNAFFFLDLSEPIQIALITFASGAFGAICGVIGTIIVSLRSTSSQLKQVVVQEYFKKRSEAYCNLLIACERRKNDPFDDKNIFAFTESIQAAILVASPNTAKKILAYNDIISKAVPEANQESAFNNMVEALHHDLTHFEKPTVK